MKVEMRSSLDQMDSMTRSKLVACRQRGGEVGLKSRSKSDQWRTRVGTELEIEPRHDWDKSKAVAERLSGKPVTSGGDQY